MFNDRLPWEKTLFIEMLSNQIKEDNEKTVLKNQERKVRRK